MKYTPGVGTHTYKAIFGRTNLYGSSASSVQLLAVTGGFPTSTTLSSAGSLGNYSLSARVVGAGSSTFSPTGDISFVDTNNNYLLGAAPLGSPTIAQTFDVISSTAVGDLVFSAAAADLNGDGITDLVFANAGDSTLTILLGLGNGTFTVASTPGTGAGPVALVIADLNADGIPDIVSANSQDNTVTILLGNGDGTFAIKSEPSTGNDPEAIVVGDVNGDGVLDLAVANASDNTVAVLLGNGDGTFLTKSTPSVGNTPLGIAIGDFNQDGVPDLATANLNADTVSILLGNGNGIFTAVSPIAVGAAPYFIVTGDFNSDGIADLATANNVDNTASILLGKGDGTFNLASSPNVGNGPFSLAKGDFNGDGVVDIATANYYDSTVTILQGNGDGSFAPLLTTGVGGTSFSIATGDFNGDGVVDFATGNFLNNTAVVVKNRITKTTTAAIGGVTLAGAGQHNVDATYSGDANFVASTSSTISLTGSQGVVTTVYLSASSTSIGYGQSLTLTATLSPHLIEGVGTNGSQVAFKNGTTTLGFGILSGGVAVLSSNGLSLGMNSLTAVFQGSTNFGASTSSALNVVVGQAVPIISWAAPSSIPVGMPLTSTQLNASASIPGVFVYSPAAGTILTMGSNTLSVTFTPTNAADYQVVTRSVTLVVSYATRFVPVTPCRVADTRLDNGSFGGPIIGGSTFRTFSLAQSPCAIPGNAKAVSVNVTVVPQSSLGYLTVWPSGVAQPLTSTMNSDGRVKAAAALIPVSTDGNAGVSIYASNNTDIILDVNGYFVPFDDPSGLAFYRLTPCRVLDTRNASGPLGGPALSAGTPRILPVRSSNCNLPSNAEAYSLNFTAVPAGGLSYLTAWATGVSRPLVSTLNAPLAAVTANAAIVSAGTGGTISVYATDNTDLVIDVNGYFAPSVSGGLSLYTQTGCRLLDTRLSNGQPIEGQHSYSVADLCDVPNSAQAFVLNSTVVPVQGLSYLTLWPAGLSMPLASTLNSGDGTVVSNLSIVPSGTNGQISVYASDSTHLILDILGYFAP